MKKSKQDFAKDILLEPYGFVETKNMWLSKWWSIVPWFFFLPSVLEIIKTGFA